MSEQTNITLDADRSTVVLTSNNPVCVAAFNTQASALKTTVLVTHMDHVKISRKHQAVPCTTRTLNRSPHMYAHIVSATTKADTSV